MRPLHGSWWALQRNNGLSLGIHFEPRARRTARQGQRYGPYVDLHLGQLVLSVGANPILAGDEDLAVSYSRGGMKASEH